MFASMVQTVRNDFADSLRPGANVEIASSYAFCSPDGQSADTPPAPPPAISLPEACGLVKKRMDATLESMKKKDITFQLPYSYSCENVPEVVAALKLNAKQTAKVIKNQCNNFFMLQAGELNADGYRTMFAKFCEFRSIDGSNKDKKCTDSETHNRVRLGIFVDGKPTTDCENGLVL